MHVLEFSLGIFLCQGKTLLPVRALTKLSPAVRRGLVPELFCCIKGMMENLLPWVCRQVKFLIKDDYRECLFLSLFLESCGICREVGRKASSQQSESAPGTWHTALGSAPSSPRWSFYVSGVCEQLRRN